MSYCTVEDVKKLTHANAKKFGLKDHPEDFEALIVEWINQSESLINSYCNKEWTENVPDAVKNVCIRLTSNMIAFYYARRDNPLHKVDDFNVKIFSSEIFTDDLRQDLKPFKKSKHIQVFNI